LSGETSGADGAGGRVFRLDGQGRLIWKAEGRALALSRTTVVVDRGFDGVAGLNRENGEERWTKTPAGAEVPGGGADMWGFILSRGSEKGFHVYDAETGERRFILPCMEKTDLELKGQLYFSHGAAILYAEPLEIIDIVDGQGKRRARWRSPGRFVGFDGRGALFYVGVFSDIASEVGASNPKYLSKNNLTLLMQDPDYKNVTHITFLGIPAFKTTFTNDKIDLSETQIWFVRNGLVYQIVYDDTFGDPATKKAILDSITFTLTK
jgi:hypothetical protein